MKQFAAGDLTRNTGDLFEAAAVSPVAITKHRKPRFVVMSMERFEALTTGRGTQVALDVTDMPEDLGKLLDKGIEDHFCDRCLSCRRSGFRLSLPLEVAGGWRRDRRP